MSGHATPTTHSAIIDWVESVRALTTPDEVVWCDGSDDEWRRLTTLLVNKGTFVRLSRKLNSFWCASDPDDVARVEDRTFICSQQQSDAGPTNVPQHRGDPCKTLAGRVVVRPAIGVRR